MTDVRQPAEIGHAEYKGFPEHDDHWGAIGISAVYAAANAAHHEEPKIYAVPPTDPEGMMHFDLDSD